jgi:hypothetical protein
MITKRLGQGPAEESEGSESAVTGDGRPVCDRAEGQGDPELPRFVVQPVDRLALCSKVKRRRDGL